jgi:large conductance mechanosensitive channel
LKKLLDDFKKFALQGDVLDLAVGIVIGTAFKTVIDVFVNAIVNPLIGAIGGKPSFDALTVEVGKGVVLYGTFLTAVINFLTVAAALFVAVQAVNRLRLIRKAEEEAVEPVPSDEVVLLAEIRDLLRIRT